MANSIARFALILALAAVGVACRTTAVPLPMLSAGHGPAQVSGGAAPPVSAR